MILDYFRRRNEMIKWEESGRKDVFVLLQRAYQNLQALESELKSTNTVEVNERRIDTLGCWILNDITAVKGLSSMLRCWSKNPEFYRDADEKNREYCERAKRLFGESVILLGYGHFAECQRERLADLTKYMQPLRVAA